MHVMCESYHVTPPRAKEAPLPLNIHKGPKPTLRGDTKSGLNERSDPYTHSGRDLQTLHVPQTYRFR